MEHEGYIAQIELDDEANLFHGEIINLKDVITFNSDCLDGLREELVASLEEYIEFCHERGEEPEKPFSGNFTVRLEPELHRRIYLRAKVENKSLNKWVAETLENAAGAQERNVP